MSYRTIAVILPINLEPISEAGEEGWLIHDYNMYYNLLIRIASQLLASFTLCFRNIES